MSGLSGNMGWAILIPTLYETGKIEIHNMRFSSIYISLKRYSYFNAIELGALKVRPSLVFYAMHLFGRSFCVPICIDKRNKHVFVIKFQHKKISYKN